MGRGPHHELEQAWLDRVAAADRGEAGADRRSEAERAADCGFDDVCLFKLLAAAVAARPGPHDDPHEQDNFPTDIYAAEGLVEPSAGLKLKAVPADELAHAMDEDTAVLFLTHIDYRSGARHDMAELNAAAHAAGALTLWDLSHSAGAVELDLNGGGCDLAVGCGYKYLNGGPGAPAFLYVAEQLQDSLQSPLPGWMGHTEPFAFAPTIAPATDIRRFLTGTPSILALAALEAGIDTFDGVALAISKRRPRPFRISSSRPWRALCGDEIALASPRAARERGSHVVFAHAQGYAVMQALIARGIIGDFRPPDLMRFGFAPLYNSFADAWRLRPPSRRALHGEWSQPVPRAPNGRLVGSTRSFRNGTSYC